MKKILIIIFILALLPYHVSAMEFTAPPPPQEAEKYMPDSSNSFIDDLFYIIKAAIAELKPNIASVANNCFTIITVVILISIVKTFTNQESKTVSLVGTIIVATTLLLPSNSLIDLASQTILELSEYGKLLLPVMASALAAQGAASTSAALYTGTAVFNTVLTTALSKLFIPIVYIFLAISAAIRALGIEALSGLQNLAKWLMTWCLKITIYLFTGYLSITGVISGSVDASAIKATKIAITGAVPVVGNILSDASETILLSAGVMKSAAGVYGLLAVISIFIAPFLEIGIQYILLKLTAAVCEIFGCKQIVSLVKDFVSAIGFILAATGTICILLLVSTVCFMKGVG